MGREKELLEAKRWLAQARDDLSAARILGKNAKYAQTCFLCQQAGEKAIKSLWYFRGDDPWGHSIFRLVKDFNDKNLNEILKKLKNSAMLLDKLYVPARYPNGLPDITPMEAYSQSDIDAASEAAEILISSMEKIIIE